MLPSAFLRVCAGKIGQSQKIKTSYKVYYVFISHQIRGQQIQREITMLIDIVIKTPNYCHLVLYFLAVMECPKLNITNGVVTTSSLTYGSEVEIVCNVGYQYNGQSSVTSECIVGQNDTYPHWEGDPHQCDCMCEMN